MLRFSFKKYVVDGGGLWNFGRRNCEELLKQ
jgi:hypothetical protein